MKFAKIIKYDMYQPYDTYQANDLRAKGISVSKEFIESLKKYMTSQYLQKSIDKPLHIFTDITDIDKWFDINTYTVFNIPEIPSFVKNRLKKYTGQILNYENPSQNYGKSLRGTIHRRALSDSEIESVCCSYQTFLDFKKIKETTPLTDIDLSFSGFITYCPMYVINFETYDVVIIEMEDMRVRSYDIHGDCEICNKNNEIKQKQQEILDNFKQIHEKYCVCIILKSGEIIQINKRNRDFLNYFTLSELSKNNISEEKKKRFLNFYKGIDNINDNIFYNIKITDKQKNLFVVSEKTEKFIFTNCNQKKDNQKKYFVNWVDNSYNRGWRDRKSVV